MDIAQPGRFTGTFLNNMLKNITLRAQNAMRIIEKLASNFLKRLYYVDLSLKYICNQRSISFTLHCSYSEGCHFA